MIEVAFSSSFKRAYRRKIAVDHQRKKRFLSKLSIFQANPFDSQLRTYKLSGKLSELWSFSVEYDLRIIFYLRAKAKPSLLTSEHMTKFIKNPVKKFLQVTQ